MAILNSSGPRFEFVSQAFNDDGSKQSVDRKRVRKQAMRAVAGSRRARGNYGQHNLRQYPIMLLDEEVNQIRIRENGPEATSQTQRAPRRISCSIPSNPAARGFESMRMRFGIDILELPKLTSSHLARLASSRLASEPAIFAGLLQCKQVSYIGHVPARYGNSVCMEDAASCLAAKMRRMLCPSDSAVTDVMVLRLYNKALKSLQNAIKDPVQVLDPDTLCATELLATFEFLGFSQDYQGNIWQSHLKGAARIIRLRGSNRFTSDYEISLFMPLSGLIFTEAMWRYESCFLVEKAWQKAVYAMIDPHSSLERSPMVVEFWGRIVHVSAYFCDVTALICEQDSLQVMKYTLTPTCTEECDHPPKSVHELVCRGLNIRRRIQEWRHEYQDMLIEDASSRKSDEACAAFRWQIFGVYLSVTALLNRLIGAVTSSKRIELERESHLFASRVLLMEQEGREDQFEVDYYSRPKVGRAADFYSTQKIVVARSILATSASWSDNSMTEDYSPIGQEHLIEKWKFEYWCKLLGRCSQSAEHNTTTACTSCPHGELLEVVK